MPDSELSEVHIYMLLVTFNLKLLTNGSNLNRLGKYVFPGAKERIQINQFFFTSVVVRKPPPSLCICRCFL